MEEKTLKDTLGDIKDLSDTLKGFLDVKNKSEAEKIFGANNVKDGKYRCKVCGKLTDLSNLYVFDTPIVKGIVAYVCPDCKKLIESNKLWKVVCVGCKELKQALEPGVNPKNGFKFEAGKSYHLLQCPVCHPENFNMSEKKQGDVIMLPLIEELLYDEKLKKQYKNGELK